MPRYSSLLTCFALTTSALFSALPAFAQQPAAPPVIVSAPVSDLAPLVIPPPPGGKLRVEMDARSEDLLGMAKSFLKGIGETGTPILGLAPGQTAASPAQAQNPVAQAIASGDLAAMLKDVNHVHIVVYEIPGSAAPFVMPVLPVKPGLKKSAFATPLTTPIPDTPSTPTFDSNSFYETAFGAEGAHRILYTDADAYKLVMVGFPDHHGFAFAASGGGYVFVERSDGYPNLEILSAFISHVTTAVMNSQTGKKLMNSTLNGGKDAEPEAKTLLKK